MTADTAHLLTTPAVLDRMARTLADHDAVVTDERTFTFAELREEVRRIWDDVGRVLASCASEFQDRPK